MGGVRFIGRKGFVAAAFAWLAAGAAPALAQQHDSVSLALPSINISFLAYYMADDFHYWSGRGLDVKTIVIAGAGSTNALIAGSVDFAASSGSSITRAWAHGQKLHALTTATDQTGEWVVIRKDVADAAHFDPSAPLAERAKILRGKTFAMGGVGSLPDAVLKAVASVGGLRPDEVTAAPMQPDQFMAAFQRKLIDGFANAMPYVQEVMLAGTGVLVSDSAKGEPTKYSPVAASMLMARADYCGSHATICAVLVGGVVDAIRIIRTDPGKALAEMKARFPNYGADELQASYQVMRAISPDPPVTTPIELENGDLMSIAAGFLKPEEKLADYGALIDNGFIK